MKLLGFILGICYVVQGVPLERFKRALPPPYTQIRNSRDCMVAYQISTSAAVCFPLEKLSGCSDSTWQELGEAYGANKKSSPPSRIVGGIDCPEICPAVYEPVCGSDMKTYGNNCELEREACTKSLNKIYDGECKSVGGIGSLPPLYLSIHNYQDCLHEENAGSHSQLCLPNTKPGICDQNTWTQITSQFDGGSCAPPEYLSIPGYDLCLTPDQHTLYGWCKPQYRPAECLSSSWASIEAIFNGGSCPSKKILIGEDLGALPPDYLFLEDHQKCLKVYQQSGASYQEKCLPKIKPRECSIKTWQSLREKFDGIGCPDEGQNSNGLLGLGAPEYLSVDSHNECLKTYQASPSHSELCIPLEKPSSCPEASFLKLKEVFNGVSCPPIKISIFGGGGGAQALPPSWLNIPGHRSCLDAYQAESHREWCKPIQKPNECPKDVWDKLASEFTGLTCPPPEEPCGLGEPCELDGIGGLPPAHLSIVGHEDCLGTYNPSPSFEANCLPSTRPSNCIPPAWTELQQKFDGEKCPEEPVIGGLGALPPAHLSILGHEDCLGTYNPSPSYEAYCLPSTKPSNCIPPAWTELQQKFDGENCPEEPCGLGEPCELDGIGGLPPVHLSILGHEDCLGTYNPSPSYEANCLPSTKPSNCLPPAWTELQQKFDGENCPEEPDQAIGLGAPEYLSIPGHEDCLETYNPSPSFEANCLPSTRPSLCIPPAWEQLKQKFNGENCPERKHSSGVIDQAPSGRPAYLEVPDFELCLDIYQVGTSALAEYCLPRDKPSQCPSTSWNQLVNVFMGIGCEPEVNKAIGLGAPAYLNVPDYRKCLGDHPSPSGSHTELCLPVKKPAGCPANSWTEMIKPEVFSGIRCALHDKNGYGMPSFLEVPGFKDCLDVKQGNSGNYEEWCLPVVKPDLCLARSWDGVVEITREGNELEPCGEENNNNAGLLGYRLYAPGVVLPPAYLGISGFEQCLGTMNSDSGSSTRRCLPNSKPNTCDTQVWEQVKESFVGDTCPLPRGALGECTEPKINWVGCSRISGRRCDACFSITFNDALLPKEDLMCMQAGQSPCIWTGNLVDDGSYVAVTASSGNCRPFSSDPLEVSLSSNRCSGSWLVNNGIGSRPGCVFCDGNHDIVLEPELPVIGLAAPEYLSIEGHEDCLGTYNPSPSYTAKCLPSTRPDRCIPPAWEELQQKYDGEKCPEQPIIGGIGGLPPAYLSIRGHEDCLGTMNSDSGSSTQRCLPTSKPNACDNQVWEQVKESFVGDTCPLPRGALGKCTAPKINWVECPYLERQCDACFSITFNDALLPKEDLMCMQAGQSPCIWTGNLVDDGSYVAVTASSGNCRPFSSDPLEVSLSSNRCSGSWLVNNGTGSRPGCVFCDGNHDIVLEPELPVIGLGAPEYLSIEGHEDCLGTYNPSPSFTAKCLPSTRPDRCIPPAWEELQQKYDGEKCPISIDISTIEDHHLCLKQVQDAVENQRCITLTPDSNCPDHIHSQILNLVFSKPKVKTLNNAIVFPTNANSDWSELVYCDDDAECRGKFGNTIMQCSEVYTGIKNGICTPVFCQDNNECPKVGDWLTSGALEGSCDTNSNHCNYDRALIIS